MRRPTQAQVSSEAHDLLQVQRAREGSELAFRVLYERHASMVHAVLLSRAPPQDADDLMQDVFLAAWRALRQLQADDHFGAWLAAIARNTCAREYRRAHGARVPRTQSLDTLADGAPAPEPPDPRAARDESAELLAVLRSLPEAYRETLAMRLVEGLTGPQIAQATGLTHGSVRVNLTRGMKLLKEALRKAGWP
jgi:RNA polymerase sigma-70 factor (ECF subfamily)